MASGRAGKAAEGDQKCVTDNKKVQHDISKTGP